MLPTKTLHAHFYRFRADKSLLLPIFSALRSQYAQAFLWQNEHTQTALLAAKTWVDFYQNDDFRYQDDFLNDAFLSTPIAQTNPDFYQTAFGNYLAQDIDAEQLALLKIWSFSQNNHTAPPKAYFGLMKYNFSFDFARQQLSVLVLSDNEEGDYEGEILYLLQKARYQPEPLQLLGEWQTDTQEVDFQANLKQLYQQCRQGQFVSKPILRTYKTQFEGSFLDYFSSWQAMQNQPIQFFYELGDYNYFGTGQNSQTQANFSNQNADAATIGFYDLGQKQAIFTETYTHFRGDYPNYLQQGDLLIVDKNLNKLYIQQSAATQQQARNWPFEANFK